MPITFKFKTRDLTPAKARDGIDYFKYTDESVTIDAGQTSKDFFIPILVDDIDEYDEPFEIVLSDAVNAVIDDNVAVGTILDDDAAPEVFVTLPEGSVGLEEGNAGDHARTAVVALSRETEKEVTVDLAIEQLAAVGNNQVAAIKNVDFREGTTHITFTPGMVAPRVEFPITMIGDVKDEENELLGVRITAAENATFPEAPFEIGITDDDALPVLSVRNTTVLEQNAGDSIAWMTISLSGATDRTVTVEYSISDGSATSTVDYSGFGGQATFAPGVTEYYIFVTVNGDTDVEPDETVEVELSDPGYATIDTASSSAIFTIKNDDFGPEFANSYTYRTIGYTEDPGAKVGLPVIAVDPDTQSPSYTIIGGDGDALFDIDAATGQIVVSGNLWSATQSVLTVEVEASDPDGHTDQITVDIEILPTVGISGDIYGIELFQDTITLTFTRYGISNAQTLDVRFQPDWTVVFPYDSQAYAGLNLKNADSTDLDADAELTKLLGGTIRIEANHDSASITLTPVQDGKLEKFEVFGVKVLGSLNGAYLPLPNNGDLVDPSDFKKVASVKIKGETQVVILDGATLFVQGAGDAGAIDKNDVNQGGLGDCWFMAAVAALAEKQPALLHDLFHENPEGGFDVTFPGQAPHHMTLTLDMGRTAADLGGDVDANGNVEVWPLMLEKAYAEVFGGGYGGMNQGGNAATVWQQLTEAATKTYDETSPEWSGTSNSNGISFRALLDAGKKVVVGTKDQVSGNVLHGDHAYVVLEVDINGDVRLYNPWGKEETVPIAELWQNINAIYVQ